MPVTKAKRERQRANRRDKRLREKISAGINCSVNDCDHIAPKEDARLISWIYEGVFELGKRLPGSM